MVNVFNEFKKHTPGFKWSRVWRVQSEKDVVDLSFKSRQDARKFKELLGKSTRKLDAKIISQEFVDDYLINEEVA